MRLTRRTLLSTAAAAIYAAPKPKTNIVFFILDDAGSGDIGCYGQKLIETPNIDRAAREGMLFTSAYAGATVCAPSRASLMTGLHGGHAPVRANAGTIPILPEDVTLPMLLKQAGYATGGFGKWGLGDAHTTGTPTRKGFDEFFGYLHQVHAHSYYPEYLWDNDKKFPLPKGAYSADVIRDRSLAFLERNKSNPYFLYVCTTLPHAKFEPPNIHPYDAKPWPDGAKRYAAMLTDADRHLGMILDRIDKNTLVIITSDNGAHSGYDKGYELFQSNGILRGEKAQVYEGGIRAPFIARWPGRIKPATTSNLPIAFCDVLPTLADVAGIKTPANIDGISILPTLTGRGRQQPREYLYWEANAWNQKAGKFNEQNLAQAARLGNFKAVRLTRTSPIELYNLVDDPSEKVNVAAKHPEIIRKVESIFATEHTPPRPHNTGSMQWITD